MRALIAAAAIMAAAPASASGFTDRQAAFHTLSAVDAMLTCEILADGGRELNPIYGKRPSCEKVVAIKVGFGALHEVIARRMHERDPKAARIFQIASITVMGGVVAANVRLVF